MQRHIDIGGDVLFGWDRMKNQETGAYIENAVVTGYLKTLAGATILEFEMPYVSNSNGRYEGTIPADTTGGLTDGGRYMLEAVAVVSGIITGRRREIYRSHIRGEN